jgi:hypothetical protein
MTGTCTNYNTTGHRKSLVSGAKLARKDGIFPMHSVSRCTLDNGTKYYTGIIHNLRCGKTLSRRCFKRKKMDVIDSLPRCPDFKTTFYGHHCWQI